MGTESSNGSKYAHMAAWRRYVQEGRNVRSILYGVLPSITSGDSTFGTETRFRIKATRQEILEKHKQALEDRKNKQGIEQKKG